MENTPEFCTGMLWGWYGPPPIGSVYEREHVNSEIPDLRRAVELSDMHVRRIPSAIRFLAGMVVWSESLVRRRSNVKDATDNKHW
jgi:hypothetical protein